LAFCSAFFGLGLSFRLVVGDGFVAGAFGPVPLLLEAAASLTEAFGVHLEEAAVKNEPVATATVMPCRGRSDSSR